MKTMKSEEFEIKLQRIYQLMNEFHFGAVVIGTQSNFSWLSCGGESKVLLTTDIAAAYLVITRENRYIVAYVMDGPRNLEEELSGMDFQPVFIHWTDGTLEDAVLNLVKGMRILSDIPLNGAEGQMKDFYNLHYPLTEWEINRYKFIDQSAEKILRKVVDQVSPGMLETDVEARLFSEFSREGYFPVVLLVGSDERIFKYRHLIAKPKKIDKYLLIILALRKFGLNAVLTRSVYFDDQLPGELSRKFDAASYIAANCISHSIPGTKFADILNMQKGLYAELGFPDEWKNHFQGGITGYAVNDSSLCFDPETEMVLNQTYNWFVTITGVNTEDTYLSRGNDGEILTTTGAWPLKPYTTKNGKVIKLPEILMR